MPWQSAAIAVARCGFIAWYLFWSGYRVDLPSNARIMQRLASAINQWASLAVLLGFALHLEPCDGSLLRYLRQAVFQVYTLRQTVVVVAAHNLKPVGLTPMLEGPLLVTLTFAACFLGYEGIRRAGWMRPLFGLKRRPSQQLSPADVRRSAG